MRRAITQMVEDPSQQHTALTAELEQRLKQEDQLLQTTYEQTPARLPLVPS